MTMMQACSPVRSVLLAVLLVAAATTSVDAESARASEGLPPEYHIGPEDMIDIAVWNNAALSRTVPVRPDGRISLPLINDVRAVGLTPTELRTQLMKRLAEYMPNPEVSVIVTDVRSFKVSVIGEVPRPGRYELKSFATVLDVLALAGGLNQFAARSRIVILRPDATAMQRIPFNNNRVVSSGGEQENFYLRSGDIILVP